MPVSVLVDYGKRGFRAGLFDTADEDGGDIAPITFRGNPHCDFSTPPTNFIRYTLDDVIDSSGLTLRAVRLKSGNIDPSTTSDPPLDSLQIYCVEIYVGINTAFLTGVVASDNFQFTLNPRP